MSGGTLTLEEAALLAASAGRSGAIRSITMLAGDASTRKYFRIAMDGGQTFVVMMAPDEGQVTAFEEMTALMRAMNVDAPEFYARNGQLALLEDCGDELMQNRLAGLDADNVDREYRRIIDGLLDFQRAAIAFSDKSRGCFQLAFDAVKLMWEVEFADTHFIQGYLGMNIPGTLAAAANKEWTVMANELAERMEVLAHRDFHSRNILVKGSRRVWIDYQDARMGRRTYDLVSLLLDPYAGLDPELSDSLADYYYERLAASSAPEWGQERFRKLYGLSGIQRIYKALGTYGYQSSANKSVVYLPYIAPALKTLGRLLERKGNFPAVMEIAKMAGEREQGKVKTRRAPHQ